MTTARQMAAMVLVVLITVGVLGCERSVPDPAERAAIEAAVDGYLGALAAAYSNLDIGPLEEWASPNEVVRVHNGFWVYKVLEKGGGEPLPYDKIEWPQRRVRFITALARLLAAEGDELAAASGANPRKGADD